MHTLAQDGFEVITAGECCARFTENVDAHHVATQYAMLQQVSFLDSPKMSTYLLAFVVAEVDFVRFGEGDVRYDDVQIGAVGQLFPDVGEGELEFEAIPHALFQCCVGPVVGRLDGDTRGGFLAGNHRYVECGRAE